MLSRSPAVALEALIRVFVLRAFGGDRGQGGMALQMTPLLPEHAMLAAADDLKNSKAWKALDAAREVWRQRLPVDPVGWLGWLIGLPQEQQIDVLDPMYRAQRERDGAMESHGASWHAAAIADAVGLDMADWWATAEGYLSHVSKAQIAQALKEAGADLAGIGDMKKDALAVS